MELEMYRDRPVLSGYGDFINDPEGIAGHEAYQPDLTFMHLATLEQGTGALHQLRLVPMRIERLSWHQAGVNDVHWLQQRLNRESRRFGVHVKRAEDRPLIASR
jgi:poly-gamma-glutamate synthesis protein (capsule biosynthesis protein)